jgi:hypothetical protein
MSLFLQTNIVIAELSSAYLQNVHNTYSGNYADTITAAYAIQPDRSGQLSPIWSVTLK